MSPDGSLSSFLKRSPCRRAYFILYLRRYDRFDDGGVEIASACPLAAAVLRLAGVHISFCISAGLIVSPVAAGNLLALAFSLLAGVQKWDVGK